VTCSAEINRVVLLASNMSVEAVMKDHWWNPPEVKVRAKTLRFGWAHFT